MSAVRILLLEDEHHDAELIIETIRAAGIDAEITTARSVIGYREALERQPWDVILADYALPRFDGISAIEMAARLQPRVPVIVLSGAIDEELAMKLLRVGASDYVMKSRLDRLGPVIVRCLRDYEMFQGLATAIRDCAAEVRASAGELRRALGSDVNAPAEAQLARLDSVARTLEGVLAAEAKQSRLN